MASVASSYDVALLDLDDTIYEGGTAIPNALEGLTKTALPTVFIMNNTSRASQTMTDQLSGPGYSVRAEGVMTSAQATVEMAVEVIEPGSDIFVLNVKLFKQSAHETRYIVVDSADDSPATMFQGLNREMTWKQMSEAAPVVPRGARLLVSSLDTTLPSERSFLVGNGSVAAVISTTTSAVPLSAGKPKPPMFTKAAERVGTKKPLAIGDRLDTNIAGGNATKVDAFMVVTDVSTHMDVAAAPPEHRPTLIGVDMTALNHELDQAHPAPQVGFTVRYSDAEAGAIVLSDGDREDPRLTNPAEAAVVVLLTVADVVQDSETGRAGAVEVAQVRVEGPAAKVALAAWRRRQPMGEVAPEPGRGLGQGFDVGPVPGPKPGSASVPSPALSSTAMPGACKVTPGQIREQVVTALSAPASTPQERVAQFERAHRTLYETLGPSRREGRRTR